MCLRIFTIAPKFQKKFIDSKKCHKFEIMFLLETKIFMKFQKLFPKFKKCLSIQKNYSPTAPGSVTFTVAWADGHGEIMSTSGVTPSASTSLKFQTNYLALDWPTKV